LLVTETATGEVIGMSRYHGYDKERGEIEIGWTFLARRCWGGVYNRELKRMMLEHAFRFVDSVVFLVHSDNTRSRRATEKIGGNLEGRRLDGYGREAVVYRIDRERWITPSRGTAPPPA